MTTLVTGAAGFIGHHVALSLLARGEDVVGVDNFNAYYDPAIKHARIERLTDAAASGPGAFRNVRLDLSDRAATAALFAQTRPTRVIHLAAQAGVRWSVEHPFDYVDANLTGFLTILEGCRHAKVEHLVFASTSSVYGANEKTPFAEADGVGHPISLYAATKRANEVMAHAYAHLYEFPCTGLRFFTVYGPWGRPDMALFKFTKAILEGQPIDVYNHGEMQRDFTYIDDIVEGVVRVADAPPSIASATADSAPPVWDPSQPSPPPHVSGVAPFRVFNIGRGKPEPLDDFIQTLEATLGRKAVRNLLPMQPGDVAATCCDTTALEAAVGYRPSVPIDVGVARFVTWYRNYYNV